MILPPDGIEMDYGMAISTSTTTTTTVPTLKRRQREQRPRPTAYYDAREGRLIFTDGSTYHFAPHEPFSAILDAMTAIAPQSVVYYVCGTASETAPQPAWYRAPVAAEGSPWTLTYRHDVPARRVAAYTRPGAAGGSLRVDLRHSPAWWDDCRDAGLMARAHRELEARLRAHFGAHALLLGTPAQTGLDLLDRSLPFNREYPVLPDEVRRVIRRNSPQARRELYPQPEGATLPAFYYYDARFAYAGCLRHVPTQLQSWDRYPRHNGAYLPYTPALYCVTGRVPADWAHIGLVPVKVSDDPDSGWQWPRTPREAFCTWVNGMELALAQQHGWDLHIAERIVFAKEPPGGDPLETWAAKLATGSTPRKGKHVPGLWEEAAWGTRAEDKLHKAALRNIVLHTIGGLHRRDTKEQLIMPLSQYAAYADPTQPPRMLPGGLMQVERSVPISRELLRYDHPEISAHVWAKQRWRLTTEMLTLDFADLLGCNTDAYYATRWDDRDLGKIGDYRVKGRILAPRPAPHSFATLLALKDESETWGARQGGGDAA